tara:strand:+ start:435 stop:1355 length:921 start_codon:yes stop_codon:yes gene_type:complete
MSLTRFQAYSLEDFSALHDAAYHHATSSTKTTFKQGLKRIERLYKKQLPELKLKFLEDPAQFLKDMEASNYSHNTNLSTLTQVVKLLKILDAPLYTYNTFLKILKEQTDSRQSLRNTEILHNLTELPSLATLQNKILSTNIEDINSFEELRYLLLVSLYTLTMPIKVRNYVDMKWYDRGGKEDGNYIIKNTFHIKNYKVGSRTTTRNIHIINEFLQSIIKVWKEMNTSDYFLANQSGRPMLQKEVNRNLLSAGVFYFGQGIGTETYRHLYIRNELEKDPNLRDKIELSNTMGYGNLNMVDTLNEPL